MKENIKIIIYIVIFVLLIIVCTKIYNNLTKDYTMQEISNELQVNIIEEISNESQASIIQEKEKKKATNFTVTNILGETVSLSDYIGKPIVINFWTTWCPPCKSELPAFDKLSKEYNGQVEFMMVNLTDGYQETVDEVKKFVQKNKYEFQVFFDTGFSASNAYQIYSIPETIFIDKEGNLVKSYIGAMSEKTLKKYVESLIGE